MKKNKSIPKLSFQDQHQKNPGFSIVTNREILTGNLFGGPNPFRPHRIQYYSILFILKGSGHHYIDFKRYAYQAGTVIFISREQVHHFERNTEREAYFLNFTKEFLDKSSLGSSLMQQLSLYNYHLYPPTIQLREEQMKIFTDLVIHLKEEYNGLDDVFTEELLQSSLKIFLIMAERIRQRKRKAQKLSKSQLTFLQFQRLLQQHLPFKRKVQFYAGELAISTKKLNRLTREIMQQAAKNYINEMAVIEMKRLLMNTSLSIKEIAFKTGFEEPTNFVKYFKNVSGLTPIAFRNQYQFVEDVE